MPRFSLPGVLLLIAGVVKSFTNILFLFLSFYTPDSELFIFSSFSVILVLLYTVTIYGFMNYRKYSLYLFFVLFIVEFLQYFFTNTSYSAIQLLAFDPSTYLKVFLVLFLLFRKDKFVSYTPSNQLRFKELAIKRLSQFSLIGFLNAIVIMFCPWEFACALFFTPGLLLNHFMRSPIFFTDNDPYAISALIQWIIFGVIVVFIEYTSKSLLSRKALKA